MTDEIQPGLSTEVIAYEADGRPVYASYQQLDWRRRAAAAREEIEQLPDDHSERPGLVQRYLDILCESPRREVDRG